MIHPRIEEALRNANLEIDDVRWYLAQDIAKDILGYQENLRGLSELIWSGSLGDRLYDLEERFLRDLSESYDSGKIDESKIGELLSAMRNAKRRRKS